MPMGVVSDSDFESELSNVVPTTTVPTSTTPPDSFGLITPGNIPTAEVVDMPHRGRQEGDVNVPPVLQKIIGETANIEGRSAAVKLAEGLGISPSSVSAYTVGAKSTATYDKPDDELKEYITTRKKKLSKKALNRLNLALHHMTNMKFNDAKLGELVGVANCMSQVVRNLAPPEPKNPTVEVNNKPTFLLYRPELKSEDKYEVIHSRE
jgi:predicted transcriptional regulator